MKITKKELFKFCDDNNDAINELQSQSDSTDFLLAVLIQQLKDSGVIDEVSPEPKPQLKTLDQSVFDGLDEKWRFAAVDRGGLLKAFAYKPKLSVSMTSFILLIGNTIDIGTGYDASNWQNSLIERDKVELTGNALCLKLLNLDLDVMCDVKDGDYRLIFAHDGEFFISHNKGERECHKNVTPVNNQGEPLTAKEAGL